MKPKLLLPLLAALALPALLGSDAHAQDAASPQPIRVTETLHNDGTKTIMRSDPDNHSSTAETYDRADKLLTKIVYELDDEGQAIGGTAYSAKGKALYKVGYKRDGANRVNEVDTYTMTGALVSRTVYQYGGNGKVIAINTYDANGTQISASTAPPNGVGGAATPAKKRGSYNPNR